MKKSMILLGMLSIGYAYAQEGNVGINTEEPKATLDIQPNADNLTKTTNEGIIAPKLTKERIAGIADANLVEGTLVYATDAIYAGTNTKVSKITEKGYYFYNGTEWVKAGADATSQIWQKQEDKGILLVDNDIENKVKYSIEGHYLNIPKTFRQISYWNPNTTNITTENYNLSNYYSVNSGVLNIFYADKIKETFTQATLKEKQLSYNHLLVDNNSSSGIVDRYLAQRNKITVNEGTSRNFASLYASVNGVDYQGEGKVDLLVGTYNYAESNKGETPRIIGTYSQPIHRSASEVEFMEGTYNLVAPRGSGKIQNIFGTRNHSTLVSTSKNNVDLLALTRNHVQITGAFTGTLNTFIGTSTLAEIPQAYKGLSNMYGIKIEPMIRGQVSNYGLHIGDVGNTTATDNYSIHTGAGKVRLGDLADTSTTTDRIVTVDANGVLKTDSAANIPAVAIGSTTAMECNADNRGKMNFIPSTDNAKSDVFGICMRNKDGNYYWAYMVGGNNPTNGTGAFGSGL